MRTGHDRSFLCAKGGLYALHHHNTGETRYQTLPREIFPFRRLWFGGFFGLVKLVLVGLLSLVFLPFLLSMWVLPIFLLIGHMDLWTALAGVLLAINPYVVAFLVTFCLIRNSLVRFSLSPPFSGPWGLSSNGAKCEAPHFAPLLLGAQLHRAKHSAASQPSSTTRLGKPRVQW